MDHDPGDGGRHGTVVVRAEGGDYRVTVARAGSRTPARVQGALYCSSP
jgi:hypothetical protein